MKCLSSNVALKATRLYTSDRLKALHALTRASASEAQEKNFQQHLLQGS